MDLAEHTEGGSAATGRTSQEAYSRRARTGGGGKLHPITEDDDVDMRTLTPEQVRQVRTRQALRQLQSPPNTQAWMPDILSENIKILLDATRDPRELLEDEEPRGRQPGASGSNDGKKRSGSGSGSKPGKRRKQAISENPEEAAKQVPLERVRLRLGSPVRAPSDSDDLNTITPNLQPIQTPYAIHETFDIADEWFVGQFRMLFRKIERLFDEYFCIHDLDEGEFYQPWAANHAPEFLDYVLHVAEPDPNGGGWDKILRDKNQRKWLLMGVMWTILENKVFNADLWGANQQEKELMFSIEKATFTNEGTSFLPIRFALAKAYYRFCTFKAPQ